MTKNNPLFVDSTKLQGDRIGTQFEVEKILLYDEETLWLIVKTHQGKVVRMQMKCVDGDCFEARVLLAHQKPITYAFVIEHEGQARYQSAIQETRATYAIIEHWEPLAEVDAAALENLSSEADRKAALPVSDFKTRLNPDYGSSIKALIDKWEL